MAATRKIIPLSGFWRAYSDPFGMAKIYADRTDLKYRAGDILGAARDFQIYDLLCSRVQHEPPQRHG